MCGGMVCGYYNMGSIKYGEMVDGRAIIIWHEAKYAGASVAKIDKREAVDWHIIWQDAKFEAVAKIGR